MPEAGGRVIRNCWQALFREHRIYEQVWSTLHRTRLLCFEFHGGISKNAHNVMSVHFSNIIYKTARNIFVPLWMWIPRFENITYIPLSISPGYFFQHRHLRMPHGSQFEIPQKCTIAEINVPHCSLSKFLATILSRHLQNFKAIEYF